MQNSQLQLAHDFVQYTDKNIFLTGKAGTGKTTFLHHLKSKSLKRMAVVAPTGVAAINAGGVTIHSFFQLPFGPYIAQSVSAGQSAGQRSHKFNNEKINLIRSLDLLVIDEISMVRADMLDGIDEVLRRYKNHSKPFGGVQLLMIGDLHQLSPVVKPEDWRILKDFYPNLFFFSSIALQQTSHISIELKHIYRQTDIDFISLLNNVRENRITADTLSQLNKRYLPGFKPADEEGYIILTTHNSTAENTNTGKLGELEAKLHVFDATVQGDFPEYSYPTVLNLGLKEGAQVMFVKNDPSREKLFYNGKIGKITRFQGDCIYVKCPSDDIEIAVYPTEWQNFKYELNTASKEIEEKVIGTFTQYPLKLAWAITIHKSQGLTFEKAVIDAGASFAHGQVYVALSRCKSFEGMVLKSPIEFTSVKSDGTIAGYTKNAHDNAPGEEYLRQSKTTFQKNLLTELFDFTQLRNRFAYCKKLAEENDRALSADLLINLDEIKTVAEKEIYSVAENFKRQLAGLLPDNGLPEEQTALQDRIKKAGAYFADKIAQSVFGAAQKVSAETDNKTVRKVVNEALDNLRKEAFIKLVVMKACQNGFDTAAYLKAKANAEIDYSLSAKAAPAPGTSATVKNSKHPLLYAALKQWRDELAAENNVPVYHILPQKTIADLLDRLPSSPEELATVKGFGKMKVNRFGPEIIDMINSYCENNAIERAQISIAVKAGPVTTDTKKASFELYLQGKTIKEIAAERGFAMSTIEGHLAHFIRTGEVDVYRIVAKEKVERVKQHLGDKAQEPILLGDLKTAMGDDFSYSELRAIVNHLEFIGA